MSRRALLLAGNGFIGSRAAANLLGAGFDVTVWHTGRAPTPAGVEAIVTATGAPPLADIPAAARAREADTVIHFLCMGAVDAAAFVAAFDGRVRRLVLISSCDVYRAYGRFTRLEPGLPDATPLDERAPLRGRLHPYRAQAPDVAHLHYWYEKIEAERVFVSAKGAETVILRLPKVYGPGGNAKLETVYGFAERPDWRWTHGHVENVAAAIACAAFHPHAAGQVYNVGERNTPTMGERLARLPGRAPPAMDLAKYDFAQDLHFSTERIRSDLGYRDVVDEGEAMRAIAAKAA